MNEVVAEREAVVPFFSVPLFALVARREYKLVRSVQPPSLPLGSRQPFGVRFVLSLGLLGVDVAVIVRF